ncbi:MAG: LysM peptidoglycan-binding domain-containing protein, partial [Chloroflexota bacterium]
MKRTLLLLAILTLVLSIFPVQPTAAQGTTYTVQPGDNLYRIALKFNTTVAAIQAANGLTTTTIRVGQVLIIPSGTSGSSPAPTAKPGATTAPSTNPGTYTVQPGDNLFRIALKFGTTVAAIQAANGLTSATIRVGQVLKIPGASGSSPAPTATKASASAPTAASNPGTYTVQPGDNLYRIALKFGTTVAAIQAANGLTSATIRVGQVLKIPGAGGSSAPAPTATKPAATAAPGATATPVPSTSGSSGFELGGQVAGFSENAATKMKFSGMKWVKRQVRWKPGDSASAHFGLITDAHNRGFKILLSVLGEPGDTTSDKFPAYATFVGDLAGAGADAIEVWNEMNIDREWKSGSISPANYVPMLQQAYNAIKSKNAGTLVISGAPAPTGFFGG